MKSKAQQLDELDERTMRRLLKEAGFNPKDAARLFAEGMRPEELRGRLRHPANEVGGLTYTHGLNRMGSKMGKAKDVDQHMADELLLYADNESSLYNQRKSIEENLSKKINDGKFDLKLSAKLWRYWIDDAAKRYSREFPGTRFGVPERNAAAEAMAQRFATDWSTDQVAQFSPDGPAWHLVRKGISSGWEATTPDRLGGKAILSVFSGKTPYRKVIVELKKLSRKLAKSWGHFEKIEEGLCETFRKIDKKSSAPLRKKAIKLFRQLPPSLKNQYEAQMHLRTEKPGKVAKGSGDSPVWRAAEEGAAGLRASLKSGNLLTGNELHRALVDAGVPVDHGEADLFAKVTSESTKIIDRYVYKDQVKSFIDNIKHERWYDIPFAYDPKLASHNANRS